MACDLDIVIVTWNSRATIDACLGSIEGALAADVRLGRVVVADNASTDGSREAAAAFAHVLPVEVADAGCNLGFAAACNSGAKRGQADALLFLNPDVVLSPGCIAAALAHLADARVGVVGIALDDPAEDSTRSASNFPTPGRILGQALGLDKIAPRLCRPHFLSPGEHARSGAVDQVMGAFWLMRRADFDRLDGWDEAFFLYMEDVDFALRVQQAGLTSLYLSDVRARHDAGSSTDQVKGRRLFYMQRSKVLYARKHFGRAGRAVTVLSAMVVEPAVRLIWTIARGDRQNRRQIWKAVGWLWSAYPFQDACANKELVETPARST